MIRLRANAAWLVRLLHPWYSNMAVLTDERTTHAERIEHSAQVRRICFVCTGNTCRSPMAEAVANDLASKREGKETFEAYSAGLYANEGEPISSNAISALELAEVVPSKRDYHAHTAHSLTAQEAEEYDLLIGMTGAHCMELMMRFPALAQKITCMPTPITDPYGGDLTVYRACLSEITSGVRALIGAEE